MKIALIVLALAVLGWSAVSWGHRDYASQSAVSGFATFGSPTTFTNRKMNFPPFDKLSAHVYDGKGRSILLLDYKGRLYFHGKYIGTDRALLKAFLNLNR